jgi:acetyltransferase AlgX (SGNH hydrolase-like protein)
LEAAAEPMSLPPIATPSPIPHADTLARPRSRLRWPLRIAMMLGGLGLGLVAAEAAFSYRDGGAFPHLNLYVADPELGVRLMPGATEAISFGGNPISHVQINQDGYRGDELPAPGTDDVLVVGDSQVFGLGVEQDQTFSAVLGKATGKHVMNGGVPTYGPAEYRQVIVEQLAKRHPKTVVLTINLVNDLFEAQHLDKDRHAVWDGWAVRKETAPDAVTSFPGRDFLYRRSHLFFALRKWRHADDKIDERGVPSEGTWRDIVNTGEKIQKQRGDLEAARHKRLDDVSWVHQQLTDQDQKIDNKILEVLHDSEGADSFTSAVARANPGDIVIEDFGEEGRQVVTTADQISAAAAVRARLRKQLAQWAKTHKTGDARQTLAAFDARDQALARLSELDVQKLQAALDPPLGAYLRDVKQLVAGAGARLVVVILPIDVQVSAEEWKKYGAKPIDMEPSKALTAELVELCRSLGVSVLDTTPVLARAEPGAFLDKDIHMTPKGHAAVAAALATTLAEPPPAPARVSERSPIPVPDAFTQAPEVIVSGSSDAACETKQVREWLRVLCSRTETTRPTAVELERDDGHEALAMVMPGQVSLVIPVVAGRELAAKITWTDRTRVLRVRWPAGAARPTLAFDKPQKLAHPDAEPMPRGWETVFHSPVERAICDCWQTVFGAGRGDAHDGMYPRVRDEALTCSGAYGAPDNACVQRYYRTAADCPALLACTRRDPASPP